MYQADLWHSHHWIDLRDWLSTIATAVAAWLAYIAITQSKRQARENAEAIVRERRVDYELGLLKELAEYDSASHTINQPDKFEQMSTRLRLLGPDRLPITRALFNLPTTDDGIRAKDAALSGIPLDLNDPRIAGRSAILDEINTTADALLAERGSLLSVTGVSRPSE